MYQVFLPAWTLGCQTLHPRSGPARLTAPGWIVKCRPSGAPGTATTPWVRAWQAAPHSFGLFHKGIR